jgi:hypothetical protein
MVKKLKESETPKSETVVGLPQGTYDTVEILPETTKSEQTMNEIVAALEAGKYFVMREGYTRNSVYILLKKLREKHGIEAVFATTQNNNVKQFVLFKEKQSP